MGFLLKFGTRLSYFIIIFFWSSQARAIYIFRVFNIQIET